MKETMTFMSVSNDRIKKTLLQQDRWNHLFDIQFIEKDGFTCVLFRDHYDPKFSFRTSPITGIIESHYSVGELRTTTLTIRTRNSEYVLF